MGRLVLFASAGIMNLVVYCWLVYLSVASHSVTAADLDIYPEEFANEAILKRIQHVLTQWRQKQLHIQSQESEDLPQFTFRFPKESNYQSDYFAVPPSDPRYYQSDADLVVENEKRTNNDDDSYQRLSKLESEQARAPAVTTDDETWSEDVTSQTSDPEVYHQSLDPEHVFQKILEENEKHIIFVAIIAGCGAAAAAGVAALFIGWYKLHNNSKAAADIEYPAYGVTGPNKEITPTGDRRLAQSAQMYHYQHQKQQIIAMESNRANNERRGSVSEGDSDEENEEGDYTVYECPGLAATGELEVKNPLFLDDPTPAAGNHTVEEPPVPADTNK